MEVPTEADWRSDPDDPDLINLDAAWAYKNFRGKTFDEAVRLFEDNALHYQEDLSYMPGRVFGFYLRAFIAYLISDAARDDADAASCFFSLIRFKAEHDRAKIVPLWAEIEPVLRVLAEHQDDFGAEWKIYGSFRTRFHEIVGYGFETSFDTAAPEIVPATVTLLDMAYYSKPARALGGCIAGLPSIGLRRHRGRVTQGGHHSDLRNAVSLGGGKHPEFGNIPDWLRYDRPALTLRFEFEGEAIANVMFMPPIGSSGVPPEVEKFLSPETLERLRWLHAPLAPNPPDTPGPPGSFLTALERFGQLFRPD